MKTNELIERVRKHERTIQAILKRMSSYGAPANERGQRPFYDRPFYDRPFYDRPPFDSKPLP